MLYFHWSEYPFLRPLAAVCLGIALALLIPFQHSNSVFVYALPAGIALTITAVLFRPNLKNRWIPGILILLAVFLLSFANTRFHDFRASAAFIGKCDSISAITLEIEDDLSEKTNAYRTSARVLSVKSKGKWQNAEGRILLYFLKNKHDSAPKFRTGQQLLIAKGPMPIPGAAFPDGFDFSDIMRYRNTYHQVFLSQNDYAIYGNRNTDLYTLSSDTRNAVNRRIEALFGEKRFYGLMQSLLIGYRDNISQEDYAGFVETGTVHVLAVSGMHVALVYGMLVWLFSLAGISHKRKWLAPLLIALLWSYAFITGLTPSVVRATLMFSLVQVGILLNRKLHIANSLFTSAFFLLLYNPFYLIDAGFQLSYLAVAGIIFLHPTLYSAWIPGHNITRKLWELSSVSVCAQLATLPVTIYFFRQFPVYFLLANLLIIPLSIFLVYAGIACLIVSPFPALAKFLVSLVKPAMLLFINTADSLRNLPGARLENVIFTESEIVFFTLILLMLILILFYGQRTALIPLMFGSALWLAHSVLTDHQYRTQQYLVCAEIRNHIVITCVMGNQARIVSDSAFINQFDQYRNYFNNHLHKRDIDRISLTAIPKQQPSLMQLRISDRIVRLAIVPNGFKNHRYYNNPLKNLNNHYIILGSFSQLKSLLGNPDFLRKNRVLRLKNDFVMTYL